MNSIWTPPVAFLSQGPGEAPRLPVVATCPLSPPVCDSARLPLSFQDLTPLRRTVRHVHGVDKLGFDLFSGDDTEGVDLGGRLSQEDMAVSLSASHQDHGCHCLSLRATLTLMFRLGWCLSAFTL